MNYPPHREAAEYEAALHVYRDELAAERALADDLYTEAQRLHRKLAEVSGEGIRSDPPVFDRYRETRQR